MRAHQAVRPLADLVGDDHRPLEERRFEGRYRSPPAPRRPRSSRRWRGRRGCGWADPRGRGAAARPRTTAESHGSPAAPGKSRIRMALVEDRRSGDVGVCEVAQPDWRLPGGRRTPPSPVICSIPGRLPDPASAESRHRPAGGPRSSPARQRCGKARAQTGTGTACG